MPATTIELHRYILHRGLVEIRCLAAAGGHEDQIAELADILEFLPRCLESEADTDADVIRDELQRYARLYPTSTFRYLDYLEPGRVPDRY